MDIDRRSLLAAAAIIATGAPARAQAAPDAISLWPAAPPGGEGPRGPETVYANGSLGNVSAPRLNVYRPSKANGAAVVVIAGGGYAHISAGVESAPTSLWLQSIGVTAFELIYRLPGEGWSRDAPFQDGQRAMRLVRSLAPSYGVDPARIGPIGFSAGGHLAGTLAVSPDKAFYAPTDAVDANSARPSFCGLIYADAQHDGRCAFVARHRNASERIRERGLFRRAPCRRRHASDVPRPSRRRPRLSRRKQPHDVRRPAHGAHPSRDAHLSIRRTRLGLGTCRNRGARMAGAVRQVGEAKFFADGRGLMQASGAHQFFGGAPGGRVGP